MPSEKAPVQAAAIRAGGGIAEDDVRTLRRAIWGDGRGVDRTWAATLMALHREVPDRAGSWAELYREALIEFFLDGRGDETVDEPAADMLLREIASDGVVADTTELWLLLDLVFRARHCPALLVAVARDSLLASIAGGTGSLSGKGGRQPGVIDADKVEAIRRLVYGSGGADGMQVGEAEALWLVDLDRASAAADNVPDWGQLFVRALAMYLLLGRGTGEQLDQAGVAWIQQHLDGGKGLTSNGRALLAYLRREAQEVDPALTALAA
jgi:hypothetical protein